MLCPSCACENPADSRFCDECGAFLQVEVELETSESRFGSPLDPGQKLADLYVIERVVETGGGVLLYEGNPLEADEERVLVLEFPDTGPSWSRQWELLTEVQHETLWHPSQRLEHEGRGYLIGPWPGQESLQQHLAGGALSVEQVARLGESLLGALEALHQAGWLHGGLSPEAIWIGSDGTPLLVRCERARRQEEPCEEYSVIQGYSSPEAYGMEGGVPDRRSDLYSLGAVLYSALTAERMNLEARESFFFFPRPQVPGGGPVVEVILKAVERKPERRFESAEQMREALERAREQLAEMPAGASEEMPEPAHGASGGDPGFVVATKSHIGLVRRNNQDAWLECRLGACERDVPLQAHLVVVADGMGGEVEGDKAASLAIRALAHEIVERFLTCQVGLETSLLLPVDPAQRNALILKRALERANRTIYQYASLDPARQGMGCTMTAVLLEGDLAVFAHVGDTRAFLIGSELDQVTTDHSLVGSLVQMGHLTREEARHSPRRSVIYRALGTNSEVEVDLYERRLAPGDYLLVCSDGIWEYYSDEELLGFFQGDPEPADLCERLVATCLERGADDNATLAVVRRLASSEPTRSRPD
jgi:protein phosphatase